MGTLPPDELTPEGTPDDVDVRDARAHDVSDPTVGVALGPAAAGLPQVPANPRHRLVTIGDSLTHGLSSGAVFATDRSWPVLAAQALGIPDFRFPRYGGPLNGLPLNLEEIVRRLEGPAGATLGLTDLPKLIAALYQLLDDNEDYWERGPGSNPPPTATRFHNLGIYGWDVRDATDYTVELAAGRASEPKRDSLNLTGARPERDNDIAAWSVLAPFGAAATQVGAAAALGRDGGIETLVVVLGSNNALGAVVNKDVPVKWSDNGYDVIGRKGAFTVWRPTHFRAEYLHLIDKLKDIAARRVVLATVPHVTIAPIANGVNPEKPGEKWREGSRYFPYYTQPWITEGRFSPRRHKHLTHRHARAIDSAIDQYNACICDAVRAARTEGRDWLVFDLCGLLDGFAIRRYVTDQDARERNAVTPLDLPPEWEELTTRFFRSDSNGRYAGGLFGLDGIHPTTSGYALVARHFLATLASAGVPSAPLDYAAIARTDTLNSSPPALVGPLLEHLGPVIALLDR